MHKNIFKKVMIFTLTFAMLAGTAGCGKEQSLNAEINPDTPVSDVQFPLKEKAELSFITSAPATSTQDPNQLAAVLLVSGSPDENLPYTLMPPMRPTTAPMA